MKSNFLQGLESDLKSLVRTKWPDCPNSNWSELEWRRRRRPDDPHTNDDVITNESSFRSFIGTVNFYAKLCENTFEKWSQKYCYILAFKFLRPISWLEEIDRGNHGQGYQLGVLHSRTVWPNRVFVEIFTTRSVFVLYLRT